MKVTFTTPQIVEATGLPKRTIQHWIKQGVLIPLNKATGSGSSNGFEWREIEIAMLLSALVRRKIQSDQLVILSTLFREIIGLSDGGFIADNPDLVKYANDMIEGGGPDLWSPSGGGAGMRQPTEKERQEAERWKKSTEMSADENAKFWSHVAYGMAVRKGADVAWEIWWDENDDVSITARLPGIDRRKWKHFAITEDAGGIFGIVLPLKVLRAD